METVQTDLVITGAHTASPLVFWKGQPVQNITGLKVYNNVVTADANAAAFSATSGVPADLVGAGMATYTARIEWLSADELLVLLDVFDNKD